MLTYRLSIAAPPKEAGYGIWAHGAGQACQGWGTRCFRPLPGLGQAEDPCGPGGKGEVAPGTLPDMTLSELIREWAGLPRG